MKFLENKTIKSSTNNLTTNPKMMAYSFIEDTDYKNYCGGLSLNTDIFSIKFVVNGHIISTGKIKNINLNTIIGVENKVLLMTGMGSLKNNF
jgi:hypothetical protein